MFPRTQFHNLVGNNLPFLHITVGIENSDRLPFRFFRKYLLPYLLAIFSIKLFAAHTMVWVER